MNATRNHDGTLRDISARYLERRAEIIRKANSGRDMTDRELRLDLECFGIPEPSVIYADLNADGEFTAVTIVSRSE